MKPERISHEQFNQDPTQSRDRFRFGVLKELQGLPQWVVWKREVDKEGKQKKAPYNPNHRNAYASVKIPKSWGSLQEALSALETGNYSGIGFMLTPPLVMVDLDHRDSTNPLASQIVTSLNSYTELSPSRTGLHILAYADKPIKSLHKEIEMYGQDRFTTITTDHIAGTPLTIENRTEEVLALYRQFAPVEQIPSINTSGGGGSAATLTALPEDAKSDPVLQELLRGDISRYTSQSSADYVLVLRLLDWTGDNVNLTRELFLSSPLGKREKATRKTGATTYIDMTIRNALRKRRNPPQRQ